MRHRNEVFHPQVLTVLCTVSPQAASWLNEKLSVALDKNWMDPSNLQGKLLKHQSFEAEIMANQNRIQSINTVRVSARETFPDNRGPSAHSSSSHPNGALSGNINLLITVLSHRRVISLPIF